MKSPNILYMNSKSYMPSSAPWTEGKKGLHVWWSDNKDLKTVSILELQILAESLPSA